MEPGEENDSFQCGTWRKSWVLNKVWNLEEELVLKVWNLEKNSFLMWNLETTTSENELMRGRNFYQVASRTRLHYYYDDACPVIHWVSLETNESERFEKMKRL